MGVKQCSHMPRSAIDRRVAVPSTVSSGTIGDCGRVPTVGIGEGMAAPTALGESLAQQARLLAGTRLSRLLSSR